MEHVCPKCFMSWFDSIEGAHRNAELVCAFCESNPSAMEVLDFQIENLENIKSQHFPKIFRSVYGVVKSLHEEKVNRSGRKCHE
jgi:hypothetical protein